MNRIQDYIARHVLVRWNQIIHVRILMFVLKVRRWTGNWTHTHTPTPLTRYQFSCLSDVGEIFIHLRNTTTPPPKQKLKKKTHKNTVSYNLIRGEVLLNCSMYIYVFIY